MAITSSNSLPVPKYEPTLPLVERRQRYGLSPQELRFVLDVVVDFDYERAYASIYTFEDEEDPHISAKTLMMRAEIQRAIASEIQAQGELLFIQKETILARVWQEAINPKAKASERLKALEMLARMIGSLDAEKGSVAPSINITITDPNKNEIEINEKTINDKVSEIIDEATTRS